MTKKQKLIRNLIILILLVLIPSSILTPSFTPLSAHKRSERTGNYGPSTIIKAQKIKGGMLYLCKYDKWYSLNTVRRGFLGLWYPGGGAIGMDNDINNPINFNWETTSTMNNHLVGKFYGIVNDPNIKSIKLVIKLNGELKTFEQKKLYDNMFLFTWDEDTSYYEMISLTGLDKDANVVYEKKLP